MPKLIHSMIRVQDLNRAAEFYRRGFGLEETHRMEFPTFTLLYLREPESGFEIELTWNKGQSRALYARLGLRSHGVLRRRPRSSSCALAGASVIRVGDLKELAAPSGAARFFFVTDPDGYKIEVLQRAGHYV